MLWFKHDADASTDAKIKKLLIRYGAIGYAIYFHCVELIVSDITETHITFELEHDAEIIADNLKIKGTADKSGIDIVNEVMRYIVELGLFENTNGHITCYKILKRLDTSMTSSARFREAITQAKREHHDSIMIPSTSSHDGVMQEEIRREEIRIDQNRDTPALEAPPVKKPTKHTYGSQGNVLLTDDEKARLEEELGPSLFAECIEFYSLYKAEKSYKSKSDNLSIRRWVIEAVSKNRNQQRTGAPPYQGNRKPQNGGAMPQYGKPKELTEEERRENERKIAELSEGLF